MLCGNNSHKMASCSGVFNALLVALIASFSPLRTPKSVSALCAEVGAQGEQPGEEDGNGGQDGGKRSRDPTHHPGVTPKAKRRCPGWSETTSIIKYSKSSMTIKDAMSSNLNS